MARLISYSILATHVYDFQQALVTDFRRTVFHFVTHLGVTLFLHYYSRLFKILAKEGSHFNNEITNAHVQTIPL